MMGGMRSSPFHKESAARSRFVRASERDELQSEIRTVVDFAPLAAGSMFPDEIDED
jgi:hypothetical protein